MALERLVSISEETTPQDLDQLEREAMQQIEKQLQEATAAAPLAETSKFAAPANSNTRAASKPAARQQPFSFFLRRPEKDGKKPETPAASRFLPLDIIVAAKNNPPAATETKSPSLFARIRAGVSSALHLELGNIRYAKAHQYESVARLLKGLSQGDDAAELYAATRRPDILRKFLNKPSKTPGLH